MMAASVKKMSVLVRGLDVRIRLPGAPSSIFSFPRPRMVSDQCDDRWDEDLWSCAMQSCRADLTMRNEARPREKSG